MPIDIRAPDGSIARFPDGMSDDEITSIMSQNYPAPAAQPDMSAAPAPHAVQPGNPLGYTPRGRAQPIQMQDVDNVVRSVAGGLPFVDRFAAGMGALTGVGGTRGDYAGNLERERARDAAYAEEHPVASAAGNVAGGVAGATALLPAELYAAGAGLAGRMAAGFGMGGLLGGIYSASETPDLTNINDARSRITRGAATGAATGAAVPLAGAAIRRLITPLPSTPQRAANVGVLRREGVPLTAGQVTGNKPLQWAESTLSDIPLAGGGAGQTQQAQREAFVKAALKRGNVDATHATTDVMKGGYEDLQKRFRSVAARNTLQLDPRFNKDLYAALTEYESTVRAPMRAPGVTEIADDLTGATARVQGGSMPGNAYQALRSKLSTRAKGLRMSDPQQAQAYRGIRNALDSAMERSIAQTNPADSDLWAQIRRHYGNYKDLVQASGSAGEQAAEGLFSPANLKSAISSGNNRGRYVRGEGDLAELARAGVNVMTPLPQSGTAPRNLIQGLVSGGSYVAGGVPGLAASIAAPAIAGRTLMSRPVQGYLGNQLMPRISGALPDYGTTARALNAAAAALAARKKKKARHEDSLR
jgi:hypothetical protein